MRNDKRLITTCLLRFDSKSRFLNPALFCTALVFLLLFSGTLWAAIDDQMNLISPGTPTSVSINSPGEEGRLHFDGIAGRLVSLQVTDSTFSSNCNSVIVSILDSTGSALSGGGICAQNSLFLSPVRLPSSGDYTVAITTRNGETGNATVLLSSFIDQTALISSGSSSTVTINTPGQKALLSFAGIAGQLATVYLDNSSFPADCNSIPVSVSLVDPVGSIISTGNACGQSSFPVRSITLRVSGTYTLIINPLDGGTCNADVHLSLFRNETASIVSGKPQTVNVGTAGEKALLDFKGYCWGPRQLANQQLYISGRLQFGDR